MAACYLNSGYTLDCRTNSSGGIKTAWLLGASGNTISGYTVTNSEVSAIGGTGTWFKFQLPKQAGSLSETLGINTTSQSITFQPEIVINLPKLQTSLRDTFVDLASQNSITALIEDNNSNYWLVGLDNGLLVTAGSLNSGQSYTDLNGATAITMTGGEPTSIRQVAVSTTIAAVFTAGGFTFQS